MLIGPSWRGAALLAAAIAAVAAAQPSEEVTSSASGPEPSAVGELTAVRLRYGVALRQGAQQDIGPGLTYSGMTPNDVAVAASVFGAGHFGGILSVQREGFALYGEGGKVTGGSLWRGHLGPAARLVLGPLRLEALIGYSFAQLPSFGNSADPAFAPAARHSAMLASRLLLDLPFGAKAEVRGEYPLPLVVSDGGRAGTRSSGYSAGGALLFPLGNAGRLAYGVLVDYQYVKDEVSSADGTTSSQLLSRAGVAMEFSFLDKVPPPKVGSLLVSVVDADSGAPLPAGRLTVEGRDVSLAANATATVDDLKPGEKTARVTAGGYLPAEARGVVIAGRTESLTVRVKREPPKVGSIAVVVVDKDAATPIAGAAIKVKGVELRTDATGQVTFPEVPIGPVPVQVTAEGYKPLQEVASVVLGKTSALALSMVPTKKRVPATISGLVRSTDGGRPVSATVEIPQARIRANANASGAFSFKIVGGTYNVVISAPGYLTQTKSVTVREGDEAIFNVDLHPDRR